MLEWQADFFETSAGARRLILGFRVVAGVIVAIAWVAVARGYDAEWLNRAGALLVIISLGLTFIQFYYEIQSDEILDRGAALARDRLARKGLVGSTADQILQEKSEGARSDQKNVRSLIFLNSILIAALGETLHGFGGWLWGVIFS